jgi:hypothetical protein
MNTRKYAIAIEFAPLFKRELEQLRRRLAAQHGSDTDPDRNWAFWEAWTIALVVKAPDVSYITDS